MQRPSSGVESSQFSPREAGQGSGSARISREGGRVETTHAHGVPIQLAPDTGTSQEPERSPSPDLNTCATRRSRPSLRTFYLRWPGSALPETGPEPGRPLVGTSFQKTKPNVPKRPRPRRCALQPRRLRAAAAKRNYLSGLRGLSCAGGARKGAVGPWYPATLNRQRRSRAILRLFFSPPGESPETTFPRVPSASAQAPRASSRFHGNLAPQSPHR